MSKKQLARVAGLLYLVVAMTGGFSELVVRGGVKVAGDAAATAENIRASATLFRVGFVSDLVDITCFMVLGLALYVLLSPVNRKVAATFVLMNAIAVAVMGANMLNHFGALAVATDPALRAALGAGPADALASLFLNFHHQGYLVAQIFFGGWLLPLGYVVYKSSYFPRALGIGLMVGCFAYLAELAGTYVSPTFDSSAVLVLAMPAALAEFSFCLWLLVKGANVRGEDEPSPAPVPGHALTAV